jgi:hypothetical protein
MPEPIYRTLMWQTDPDPPWPFPVTRCAVRACPGRVPGEHSGWVCRHHAADDIIVMG